MFAIAFPTINPVIYPIFGPFKISWYSLAYITGILLGLFYAKVISKKFDLKITGRHLDDFVVWAIIGIILGGRLGYVLFYDPLKYIANPVDIVKIHEGGMSFHGGIIGIILASYFFCRKYKIPFLNLTDILAVTAPIGLFFGRIANFINAEAYGRVTAVEWGVIFPGQTLPRHPSQLYEAFFEGFVLFCILTYLTFCRHTLKSKGILSAIFLISYAIFRGVIENFREPDLHIGFIYHNVTMGQILCIPMFLLGIYLLVKSDAARS